jgi:hypothetical protein
LHAVEATLRDRQQQQQEAHNGKSREIDAHNENDELQRLNQLLLNATKVSIQSLTHNTLHQLLITPDVMIG